LEHVEEDYQNIYIFTEYAENGDLFTYMQKNGIFDEGNARKLFSQMVDAVDFLHRKLHICHHDIKLENCVIDDEFTLKLIDFGFAIEMMKESNISPGSPNSSSAAAMVIGKKLMKVYDGSPAYSPLEILMKRPHDESVDIYSMGIVLYYMITGYFPFCDPDKTTFEELCNNVQENRLDFPEGLSPAVQDLIIRMLAPRHNRVSIGEIRLHTWLNDFYETSFHHHNHL